MESKFVVLAFVFCASCLASLLVCLLQASRHKTIRLSANCCRNWMQMQKSPAEKTCLPNCSAVLCCSCFLPAFVALCSNCKLHHFLSVGAFFALRGAKLFGARLALLGAKGQHLATLANNAKKSSLRATCFCCATTKRRSKASFDNCCSE